ESLGYVTELDLEEDPEEYEDDETEDGPDDYPMDGGDDGDNDDSDSSRDNTDDEDEEEEEEEEHLAPADSAAVVPANKLVSPPEGTEPVIPPPSTNITIRARITVRPQASISLPSEAEVERLLAMTTPSPSPPISLSPPPAEERLARIASTQALFDAFTSALPLPLLPPPADHRDDIPEFEQPPRKRLCLSTLGSRYEIGKSSTAKPTEGRGVYYGFVSTVDAEARRQGISEVGYGIRVIELAELHEHDTQDLYDLLEDAQDSRSRISQRVDMDSQRVDLLIKDMMTLQETVWMVEEEAYASQEAWAHSIGLSQATHQELQTHRDHVHETRFQMQQTEIAVLQETDRRHQAQMVETLYVIRDIRRIMAHATRRGPNTTPNNTNPNNRTPESIQAMIDQALLRNFTNEDGSHSSHGDNRRNVQTARPCFYADFMSGCPFKNQVKFATYTLLGAALTWWNGQIRTLGPEAYAMTWE
ncbi:hypothetical protein Tco_1162060, partial [Tanacetum coccineum]